MSSTHMSQCRYLQNMAGLAMFVATKKNDAKLNLDLSLLVLLTGVYHLTFLIRILSLPSVERNSRFSFVYIIYYMYSSISVSMCS